jgi:hypothetical protein
MKPFQINLVEHISVNKISKEFKMTLSEGQNNKLIYQLDMAHRTAKPPLYVSQCSRLYAENSSVLTLLVLGTHHNIRHKFVFTNTLLFPMGFPPQITPTRESDSVTAEVGHVALT